KAGDDHTPVIHPFLPRIGQELLAIDGRHIQIHDQQVDRRAENDEAFERIGVGFDGDTLAIAILEEPSHLFAKRFAVVNNYNQLWLRIRHEAYSITTENTENAERKKLEIQIRSVFSVLSVVNFASLIVSGGMH